MTTLKVGIADYEEMKARTFAKILSAGNRELLRLIAERTPGSLDELARLSGREKSNLSRTLKTRVSYDQVELELPLTCSA